MLLKQYHIAQERQSYDIIYNIIVFLWYHICFWYGYCRNLYDIIYDVIQCMTSYMTLQSILAGKLTKQSIQVPITWDIITKSMISYKISYMICRCRARNLCVENLCRDGKERCIPSESFYGQGVFGRASSQAFPLGCHSRPTRCRVRWWCAAGASTGVAQVSVSQIPPNSPLAAFKTRRVDRRKLWAGAEHTP